ncbi:MAG: FAD-dependent monooxygenase [Alphaproteobacteria bacterium]|nr:FAD-dependent monooxygenase [Alphaproteobacteria bacterium]
MNSEPLRTPVLIVGGGMVGLTLAVELGSRGVGCMIVNDGADTAPHPQGNSLNSRTKEHYRRLGLGGEIRAAGLPRDHASDVVYVTRFTGWELARLPMPSTAEKLSEPEHTAQTPEPIHRANFFYIEPILKRRAEELDSVDVRFGHRLLSFEQDDGGVIAKIERTADGAERTVRCDWLVGCDGARSTVRKALGIGYGGKGGEDETFMRGRMLSTYVRAPALTGEMTCAPGWHYWTVNGDTRSSIATLDARGEYVALTRMPPGEDETTVDAASAFLACVGKDIPVEVLSVKSWMAGLALVADRYQDRRVLMAGDSVHLFTPTGGFGMNTGVDDVANLAWKLAGVVQGWAPPVLLDTYEAERRPIGIRNTTMSHQFASAVAGLEIPDDLEDDSNAGAAARAKIGAHLATFTEEFRSLGIQLGARYDGSPLVVADGTTAPEDSPFEYVPSAVPGGRAPHAWLDGGRALQDLYGPGFTLLNLSGEETGLPDTPVPLTQVLLDDAAVRELYGADFVLVRPDHHIAWRGNDMLEDFAAILARCCRH